MLTLNAHPTDRDPPKPEVLTLIGGMTLVLSVSSNPLTTRF